MNKRSDKTDILLAMIAGIEDEKHILKLIRVVSEMITEIEAPPLPERSISIIDRSARGPRPVKVLGKEFKTMSAAFKYFGIVKTSTTYYSIKNGIVSIEDLIPEEWFKRNAPSGKRYSTTRDGLVIVPSDAKKSF